MIYTTDIIGDQWKIFIEAVAVGTMLGGCYDVLRILRTVFRFGKKLFMASDFLFCLWAGFLSFSFLLNSNFGIPRFYIFFGEAIGFLAWYLSIGRVSVKFGKLLRRGLMKIFAPFAAIFRKIIKKAEKHLNIGRNYIKKEGNKGKRLLKKKAGLVYNVLCLNISKAFLFCGKKAGKEHEKSDGNGTEETQKRTFPEDSGHCVRNLCSLFPDFDSGEHKR